MKQACQPSLQQLTAQLKLESEHTATKASCVLPLTLHTCIHCPKKITASKVYIRHTFNTEYSNSVPLLSVQILMVSFKKVRATSCWKQRFHHVATVTHETTSSSLTLKRPPLVPHKRAGALKERVHFTTGSPSSHFKLNTSFGNHVGN